jgi:hypothetical protein
MAHIRGIRDVLDILEGCMQHIVEGVKKNGHGHRQRNFAEDGG